MDTLHVTYVDALLRSLDFHTTLCLLFLTALGTVFYYLWTTHKMDLSWRSLFFLAPIIVVGFSIYLIDGVYDSLIVDLQKGGLSKETVGAFRRFTWFQPKLLGVALAGLIFAMILNRK